MPAPGDLMTVADHVTAFYRLMGVKSGDPALTRRGESPGDIAHYHLTRGSRAAQRFMLKNGYRGWKKRTATPLTWQGTDEEDGGRYILLPDDFLKAAGDERYAALVQPNGTRWGQQVDSIEGSGKKGAGFYVEGNRLQLLRTARPPAEVYLEYHYLHPAWVGGTTPTQIDFPIEARPLIVAKAANLAKEEAWAPGDQELKQSIARAVSMAEAEARDVARQTREPRKIRGPRRAGNRW